MTELGAQSAPPVSPEARPPSQRGPGGKPDHPSTWRTRIGTLFPADLAPADLAPADLAPADLAPADLAPRRPARWYWLAVAVVLGALVSLGRGPGVLRGLDSIWAEDGSDFLTDALNRDLARTVVRPVNGYFVVVPRLLAIPASLVPVEWGPAVLTVEAALVTALMALGVYLASRTHLRHPLARLVAAAPVLAVPVGANIAAEAANNVATLQFAAVYFALWMLLWVPARRGASIIAAVAVVAVSASTFLAVVLLPLAVLRLYARRDRYTAVMVGGLLVGLAANLTALALHLTARPAMLASRFEPAWALSTVGEWALPHALFGYRISGNGAQAVDPQWLVWLAWPIILLVPLIALARVTRPQWKLATVLVVTAFAMVTGTVMQYGGTELRYVIAPELMLFAALAALWLPRPDRTGLRAWAPLVALSVCLVVVLAASYRTTGPRAGLSSWSGAVDRARITCADPANGAAYVYPGSGDVSAVPLGTPLRNHPPPGFPVLVPCDRLR